MINCWRIPVVARLIFRVSYRSRQRKLAMFYARFQLGKDDRVLDIGVAPMNWSEHSGVPQVENFLEASYPWPENIVALSIDRLDEFSAENPQVLAVQGDGCDLPFVDGAFDVVFSNAVIEHVGNRQRQARFVSECLRVARRGVFVAAPNQWFPYDTHVAFPLVHWLPRRVWKRFVGEPGLHLLSPGTFLKLFPASSKPVRLGSLWSPSVVVATGEPSGDSFQNRRELGDEGGAVVTDLHGRVRHRGR